MGLIERSVEKAKKEGLFSVLCTLPTFYRNQIRPKPYEFNKICYRLNHTTEWDVLDDDWNTLLILDGCRFDLWTEADTPWTATERHSPASTTPNFLQSVFDGHSLSDTVYITANPMIARESHLDINFHHVDHVWDWVGIAILVP